MSWAGVLLLLDHLVSVSAFRLHRGYMMADNTYCVFLWSTEQKGVFSQFLVNIQYPYSLLTQPNFSSDFMYIYYMLIVKRLNLFLKFPLSKSFREQKKTLGNKKFVP